MWLSSRFLLDSDILGNDAIGFMLQRSSRCWTIAVYEYALKTWLRYWISLFPICLKFQQRHDCEKTDWSFWGHGGSIPPTSTARLKTVWLKRSHRFQFLQEFIIKTWSVCAKHVRPPCMWKNEYGTFSSEHQTLLLHNMKSLYILIKIAIKQLMVP